MVLGDGGVQGLSARVQGEWRSWDFWVFVPGCFVENLDNGNLEMSSKEDKLDDNTTKHMGQL